MLTWVRRRLRNSVLGRLVRRTRLWQSYAHYVRIPVRLRLVNWFVQRLVYRTRNLKFSLHFTSRVIAAERLRFGRGVEVGLAQAGGLYVQALNGIQIGDDTILGPSVKLISSNHKFEDYSAHIPCEPIRIGRRCWLGANVAILPGVQLGDGVIVGAGAVVTRSFPSRCVIAGVPAKVIKTLPAEGEGIATEALGASS